MMRAMRPRRERRRRRRARAASWGARMAGTLDGGCRLAAPGGVLARDLAGRTRLHHQQAAAPRERRWMAMIGRERRVQRKRSGQEVVVTVRDALVEGPAN